jgi:hypothetical protein
VGLPEVGSGEVGLSFWMLFSPAIPNTTPSLQKLKLLLVCHDVVSSSQCFSLYTSRRWLTRVILFSL